MPKTQGTPSHASAAADRLGAGHLALNARPLDEPAELDMVGPGRGRRSRGDGRRGPRRRRRPPRTSRRLSCDDTGQSLPSRPGAVRPAPDEFRLGDTIRSTRLSCGRSVLSPSGYRRADGRSFASDDRDPHRSATDARIIDTTRRRRRWPPRSRGTESSGWNTGDFRPAQQSETTTLSTTARSVDIAAIDVASSIARGQIDPSLRRHTSRIDLIDDSDQLLDLQRLREDTSMPTKGRRSALLGGGIGRDADDPRPDALQTFLTEPSRRLQSVHDGHHQIHENQIILATSEQFQCLAAVSATSTLQWKLRRTSRNDLRVPSLI